MAIFIDVARSKYTYLVRSSDSSLGSFGSNELTGNGLPGMDYQEWTIGNRLSGIEITTALVFAFCVVKAIYLAAHELMYKEKMISEK